jgi:2-hydroxychromene-2-carboxylate isomerase
MTATIDFWFDFASTYSYLTALRIERAAADSGVAVTWRPFLLGPIFAAQGWTTSPFNVYPARGRYMIRDISRIAEARGIPFELPKPFPQNSLLAARAALALDDQAQRAAFSRAVFTMEFAENLPINDPAVIGSCLDRAGADKTAILAATQTDAIKSRLRVETAKAERLGIFGAPAFLTADGELFWGDDRLEMALDWAAWT